MKKNLWIAAAMLCGMFGFSSCSEELNEVNVPKHVEEQFNMKFPNARSVKWTMSKGYSVASFIDEAGAQGQNRCSAWFSLADGLWDMTEVEMPIDKLPQPVREAFEASVYAAAPWVADAEIEVLQRDGADPLYVVSVEDPEADTEMELYFSADGLLVKEVLDEVNGNDHAADFLPVELPANVQAWIEQTFAGAKVVDADLEDGGIEVDVVYKDAVYELFFNGEGNWLYTKQEFEEGNFATLPPVILSAIRSVPGFAGLEDVDDVDFYITAEHGNFYCVELESDADDVKVCFDENGIKIDKPVFNANDVVVCEEVRNWINQHYQNAVIVGKDYDDGVLEVEFRHEGVEKTALFNGSGKWIGSEWDVDYANLPSAVLLALQNNFVDFIVDRNDIEAVEDAKGVTLHIEIKNPVTGQEQEVLIGLDGVIVK